MGSAYKNIQFHSAVFQTDSVTHGLCSVLMQASSISTIYQYSEIHQFSQHFCPRNFPFKLSRLLFRKVEVMSHLFCDCCGDSVKAVYPCKFVFHDGLSCDFNICLDCMNNGTLEINLQRKRLVSKILLRLSKKREPSMKEEHPK